MSFFTRKPQHSAIITNVSSSSVAVQIPAGTSMTSASAITYTGGTIGSSSVFIIRSYSGYYNYMNKLMQEHNVVAIDEELYNKLGRDPTCEEIERAVLLRKSALGKKLYE